MELRGLEPQTSCMPSAGGPSTGVHPGRSPSRPVHRSALVRPGCGTSVLYVASGSGHPEALGGLRGDLGDELEVLVQVQHGQPGQFRCRGDDQVRD